MDVLPKSSIRYLDNILAAEDLHTFTEKQQAQELEARNLLHDFEEHYSGVLKEDNLMDILTAIRNQEQQKKQDISMESSIQKEDIEDKDTGDYDDI